MALDATRKVPLPEHGVVKKRMGDKTYIYYATAVYRNEKGQPTADRVSIGRYDDETGMLIPNRNYYEIDLKKPAPPMQGMCSSGTYAAFRGVCDHLGLTKILKSYFPENWELMLTAAQYML